MLNFFKKEYNERLKSVHSEEFIEKYIVYDEDGADIRLSQLIDDVFQKGWEAFRASLMEAAYISDEKYISGGKKSGKNSKRNSNRDEQAD